MTDTPLPRSGQTKNEIVAAAFTLFSRQGYHGTSMRQIAEAAHIALGGIYNHFENKEQIFLQVLLEHHPIYEILPDLLAAEGETLHSIITSAATRLAQRFEARVDFLNIMFIELVEFEGKHLNELFNLFLPQILVFAKRLQTWQAELRPIPQPLMLRSFIGLFFSYVITEYLIGQHLPAEMRQGALAQFVNIFLYGISKGTPDELPPGFDHP
jgi:AcrR family transcriptional regulator